MRCAFWGKSFQQSTAMRLEANTQRDVMEWNEKNPADLSPPKSMNGEGNGNPLQYSCLENPMDGGAWWAAVHGVARSRTRLSNFTFTFHFHALEKEMATHSSVLAWKIPGTGEPGGLPSTGLHRVGHDWSDLAAVAATELKCNVLWTCFGFIFFLKDSANWPRNSPTGFFWSLLPCWRWKLEAFHIPA